MKLLLQRVAEARILVNEHTVGAIGRGLLAFLGVCRDDSDEDAAYLLNKLLHLRIFPDDSGKMNRSILESGGSLLIVSQFTLCGDASRGRRPSFDQAAPPEEAQRLYNYFVESARRGPVPVETGVFQAMMKVHLINDGPVTFLLDSADRKRI
jgi:D-aminoacyl-tRNA deacylase